MLRGVAAPAIFALALFLSSALLFLVEPMFARMVLPLLGGTPAVWNTCLVFFQVTLLAGYAYAHVLPTWLGLRRQALVHLLLLLAPLALLPIAVSQDWAPPTETNPIPALLGLLAVSVGLPFLLVSTSAPLLQKWFAATGHASAADPYFLYGASNLGSLLALAAYPALFEPLLPLAAQSRVWTGGYLLLIGLTAGCAVLLWRLPAAKPTAPARPSPPPTAATRFRWVLLAFVPSSLLLSVTTYLSTDIAAIPLLWVLPLALYLLTFVLVFARRPLFSHVLLARLMPLMVIVLTLTLLSEATRPVWLLLPLHLLGLFAVAMVCHGELARQRPAADHLTEFYLWLALGGALGGLFNALVAPLIFSGLVEYPLVLVLACFLRPAGTSTLFSRGSESRAVLRTAAKQEPTTGRNPVLARSDVLAAVLLGMGTVVLILAVRALSIPAGTLSVVCCFAVPVVVCYTFLERPTRFGLGIAALFLAGLLSPSVYGKVEYRERSFYGIHRVTEETRGGYTYRQLIHGNTVHGRQCLDRSRRREPLSYYHRSGPIGQALGTLRDDRPELLREVAVIGLGAGSLACYADKGQHWTYYEINPVVQKIATEQFTFLADCKGRLNVVLGDARLKLAGATGQQYGLIVVDAFSSDAIPVHLITREALDVYDSRLAPHGILAMHISNDYLDFQPVVAALAAERGWTCLVREDRSLTEGEKQNGKDPSIWVLLARQEGDLDRFVHNPDWRRLDSRPGAKVWTDDFYDLISVFQWNGG